MDREIILELTKEAVRNTYLSSFLTDEEVERRFNENVKDVGLNNIKNYSCEATKTIDGVIYINESIFNENEEYIKIALTSAGIYSILGSCKKYDVTNSILSDYFAKLSLKRTSSINPEKPIIGRDLLNNDSIFEKHILLFHDLIGEEAMAYLTARIDEDHTFYDNLYELINHMSIKGSFDKKTLKKLNKLLKKMYKEQKEVINSNNKYKLEEGIYSNKLKRIINVFSEKYDFNQFFKFLDSLRASRYNFETISKSYGLNLSDLSLSRYEAKIMDKLINDFDSIDFEADSYEDIINFCEERITFQADSILYKRKNIENKGNFSIHMLISKLIIPAAKKSGMTRDEKETLEYLSNSSDYLDKNKIKKYIF